MACEEVESWTFNGLVAAFLDLAIAYVFLSASALAYFASKFLGLFGLSLPCSCDAPPVVDDKSGNCWLRFLLDHHCHSISNVQSSVRRRLPFDFLRDEEIRGYGHGIARLEGDGSSQSYRNKKVGGVRVDKSNDNISTGEMLGKRFDLVRKGLPVKKVKCGHLRHRRRRAVEDGTMAEVPSYYSSQPNTQMPPVPPPNDSKVVNKANEGKRRLVSSCGGTSQYDAGSSTDISLPVGLYEHLQSTLPGDEGKQKEKEVYPSDDSKSNDDPNADDERNTLRVLEQALEEERAARLALCQELEQERNAAASAADEAMAMILRLQEEKASVEMAASQYQRMIEEKSAYDYEEISILEEMLLKKERETHFLENELDAYKMMILGNEQLDSGMTDIETMIGKGASFSQHSSEDAPTAGLGYQVKTTLQSSNPVFQEGQGDKLNRHLLASSNKNIDEELKRNSLIREENNALDQKEHMETASLANHSGRLKNKRNITGTSQDTSGVGPFDNDVHIIEDKSKPSNKATEKGNEKLPLYPAFSIPRTGDNPAFSKVEPENGFNKSSSDASTGLPPIGSSRSRPQSIRRRNSMSAADFERSKVDYEVGWLRERRKIVKEGREKLNIPTGLKTKEKVQLQNMEKIVGKLREIRQLSEPGKAVQQALLTPPPLSARVMSRRRRAQSVTLQTQRST